MWVLPGECSRVNVGRLPTDGTVGLAGARQTASTGRTPHPGPRGSLGLLCRRSSGMAQRIGTLRVSSPDSATLWPREHSGPQLSHLWNGDHPSDWL